MQYAMNAVLKMRMILEISRQRDGNPMSLLITLNAYFSQAIFFMLEKNGDKRTKP